MTTKTDAVIPGLKLIRHSGRGTRNPDDYSFPWRLDVVLRPPAFLQVATVSLRAEEICVRGVTRKALEQFVEAN